MPTLASMATMGLVAPPGMMTGAILGGASPCFGKL
ncbi:MAG: ABC transporter permease [Desulfosarcina sp.]|nr:ABC transporter permease [Desulfobacterales bacterium]